MTEPQTLNTSAIAPLGPGDLIDRAIRFYRGNFWTFLAVAAPPVVVGAVVSVIWTFITRNFIYSGDPYASGNFLYYVAVWLGGLAIWFVVLVCTFAVMGGASRNFVRHLLFGEKITFKDTYKNLWARLGSLIIASFSVVSIVMLVGGAILYFGLTFTAVFIFLAAYLFENFIPLAILAGVLLGIAGSILSFGLFFLIAARFAYVPQSITVEGIGPFAAIARSASLASGNLKRFSALFVFTVLAVYAGLAIVYVPIGWYAWYEGINLTEFLVHDPDLTPAWYEITTQLISQASLILLSPIWMVGLCLMYVDERVRHEGYDIELMANRKLGEIPDVPIDYINPLQPALVTGRAPTPVARTTTPTAGKNDTFTTLGLK